MSKEWHCHDKRDVLSFLRGSVVDPWDRRTLGYFCSVMWSVSKIREKNNKDQCYSVSMSYCFSFLSACRQNTVTVVTGQIYHCWSWTNFTDLVHSFWGADIASCIIYLWIMHFSLLDVLLKSNKIYYLLFFEGGGSIEGLKLPAASCACVTTHRKQVYNL